MNDKERKALQHVEISLGRIIADLEELEHIHFLPHQIEKLRRLQDQIVPLVHGGGTGRD